MHMMVGLVFVTLFASIAYVFATLRLSLGGRHGGPGADDSACDVSRSKGSITDVTLAVSIPDTMRFILRREGLFDRAAKWLGLAREWQTDDPAFDRRVYILSEDRELLDSLDRDGQLRGALLELLLVEGVKAIRCHEGQLWITGLIGKPDSALDDHSVGTLARKLALPALRKVRERLVAEHAAPWRHERDPALSWQLVVRGLCLLLAIAGLVGGLWANGPGLPHALVHEAIYRQAAQFAAGGAVALVLVLALVVGRASRTHVLLAQVLLVGVPGTWMLSAALLEDRNATADITAPETLRLVVANRYVSHGRRSTTYHMVFRGWRDPRVDGDMIVAYEDYNRLSGSACAEALVHPGALGDPWLEQLRPASRC